jgi:membrane-bound lytic murein transglycosylase B
MLSCREILTIYAVQGAMQFASHDTGKYAVDGKDDAHVELMSENEALVR